MATSRSRERRFLARRRHRRLPLQTRQLRCRPLIRCERRGWGNLHYAIITCLFMWMDVMKTGRGCFLLFCLCGHFECTAWSE